MRLQPVIGLTLGLYPGVGLSSTSELRLTFGATSLWMVLMLAMYHGIQNEFGMAGAAFLIAWPLALALVPTLRFVARTVASRFAWWGQPALIFGGGRPGRMAYEFLQEHPGCGLRPVGLIDDVEANWSDRIVDPSWYLGPPSMAATIADRRGVFWGVLPMPAEYSSQLAEVLDRHAAVLPHLLLLSEAGTAPRCWKGSLDYGDMVGLRVDERLLVPTLKIIKRGLDLLLTAVGCVLISPLLLFLAAAVKWGSPGPVFYSQERIGLEGRRFRAWKFRSMVTNADAVLKDYLQRHPELRAEWERDHKLKRDPRVTAIGRLLRKTSLDELPQLWNVLRGDMSLVGPRPIVQAEIPKYGSAYGLYLRVRPGITGLWQISGRNNTTYEKRVRLDMSYVRNWSPWLDLYILSRTIKTVLCGEGAY